MSYIIEIWSTDTEQYRKGVKVFEIKPYTSERSNYLMSIPFHYIQIDKPSTLINYLFVFYVSPLLV